MRMLAVLAAALLLSAGAARSQPPDGAPSPNEARQAADQANAKMKEHLAGLPAMRGGRADAPSLAAGAEATSRPAVTLGNGVSGTPGDERFERGLKDIQDRAADEAKAHVATEPRN